MTTPGPVEQENQLRNQLLMALAYAQSADVVAEILGMFPDTAAEAVKLLFRIGPVRKLLRNSEPIGSHPAQEQVRKVNLRRRVSYLRNAAVRITGAWSGPRVGRVERIRKVLEAERRFLDQHIQATQRRSEVADAVAKEAKRVGRTYAEGEWSGLLGWYAVLDERTSAECRQANGRNFDPNHIPRIGFPGSVHPHCRCFPGPPHVTEARVEHVRPDVASSIQAGRRRGLDEIAASMPGGFEVVAGWRVS